MGFLNVIATLEERQRLARELHDSVTQTLFSASTIADSLSRVIDKDIQKAHNYLQDLQHFTHGAMAEMRSLLVELRPEALTQTELGVLLRQLSDVFTGKTQVEVVQKISNKIILPPDAQIVFYRIAQETFNNIAHHSHAEHVSLDLQKGDN